MVPDMIVYREKSGFDLPSPKTTQKTVKQIDSVQVCCGYSSPRSEGALWRSSSGHDTFKNNWDFPEEAAEIVNFVQSAPSTLKGIDCTLRQIQKHLSQTFFFKGTLRNIQNLNMQM